MKWNEFKSIVDARLNKEGLNDAEILWIDASVTGTGDAEVKVEITKHGELIVDAAGRGW